MTSLVVCFYIFSLWSQKANCFIRCFVSTSVYQKEKGCHFCCCCFYSLAYVAESQLNQSNFCYISDGCDGQCFVKKRIKETEFDHFRSTKPTLCVCVLFVCVSVCFADGM